MSEHQCVTQARVKLSSNDYQKKKPRILDQGIYAGLHFGSLAKIQFYGWLWANLVRSGSHRQGQQHHKATLVWARDKDSIQGVVSFWVNNTDQSLQTAPLPRLSDDTHRRVQQPKVSACARSQHSSLFQTPTELKATSWHLLPPLWSHTLLC